MTFLHHRQRVGGSVVARCCHSCKRTVCCPLSLLPFKGKKSKNKNKEMSVLWVGNWGCSECLGDGGGPQPAELGSSCFQQQEGFASEALKQSCTKRMWDWTRRGCLKR